MGVTTISAHDPCDTQPCVHALRARQETILQVRHQLRTPLAALRSFLELATEDDLNPELVHECLAAIDRNVLRLSEALDQISTGEIRIDPTLKALPISQPDRSH